MGHIIPVILIILVIFVLIRNIRVVPQEHAYIIERLGKFNTVWYAGLHVKIPLIDQVVNKISLKEQVFDFPPQPVITKDNVSVKVDSVVFSKVFDPQKYTYGVENPIAGLQNLSATTLRSIIGGMELDTTLSSRENINAQMEAILDEATDPWGIKVNRVELKNIDPPPAIEEVMTKQMRAERERRQTVLEAQAHQESVVSRAEGDKKAKVLAAEAEKEAKIALAQGEAESIRLIYEAQAQGLEQLREAHIDESVLKLKGLEALRDVADGRATKIYMPSDIAGIVSTLGLVSESLGIGDATAIDKSAKPAPAPAADPCVNEETSAEGVKAAAFGGELSADIESRRKDII
ncbi:MAG: SPFH/Band 7/PHB domain protein [Mogibacterium sp.]|nr:SPFH/Band 7/PHB domain protein [Mogibacterium sp.]